MTAAEVDDFIFRIFPQIWADDKRSYTIEALTPGGARVRMHYAERHLRPGGTISGPAMMALCDLAMWVVVLGHIGPLEDAVTTNLNINFLRRPAKKDLIGDARLLKLGKRLAVGDVTVYSEGEDAPVAHTSLSYAVPVAK